MSPGPNRAPAGEGVARRPRRSAGAAAPRVASSTAFPRLCLFVGLFILPGKVEKGE